MAEMNAAQRADRQKKFYTKQRQDAEERADEGDSRARDTVSKIYSKLGKKPREYTDTEAVDKTALGAVGGPEDMAGVGLAWGGKKLAGMAMRKLGSKVAEGAEKFMGKVTGKADTVAKAENKTQSTGRKMVGKAADGQVKRGSPKPKLAKAKSVEKTGSKAPDRVNKPIRKEEPKTEVAAPKPKPKRAAKPKKTAPKVEEKPKAKVKSVTGKNPSKASRGKMFAAPKGTAFKKAPEPPKPKAEDVADAAAKKAVTKKAMDAKAKLKANLAKKGKLKKS